VKPLYLEPDEEITSVIDKINDAGHQNLGLVVAKNSTIMQSLVNLKLLAKEAKDRQIEIAIITNNKIGQRLARQVGLQSYPSLGAVAAAPQTAEKPTVAPTKEEETEPEMLDGVPVHQYNPPSVKSDKAEEPVEKPMPPVEEEAKEPVVEVVETEEPVAADEAAETEISEPKEEVTEEQEDPKAESEPGDFKVERIKPSSPGLPPIIARNRIPGPPREPFKIPWKAIIIASAIVVVLGVVMFFVLPSATVTLTLPATAVNKSATFNVVTGSGSTGTGEVGSATIAGNLLNSEKSGTKVINATGKKDIGNKASGTISLKNCEDTNAHSVAAGTKFTSNSKAFTNGNAVIIPAGQFSGGGAVCNSSSVNVVITATDPGESYNLNNATFTITGLTGKFTATGSTTGGLTKTVTVLTQEDVDNGLKAIRDDLTAQAKAELQHPADGQILLDGALFSTETKESVDKTVGSQVDNTTATVSYKFSVITYSGNDFTDKVKELLKTDLTDKQDLVIPDDKQPVATFTAISGDKTSMTISGTGSGFIVAKLDKPAIIKQIKNKSVDQAKTWLTDNEKPTSTEISLNPSWWPSRMPFLAQKITIEYGFSEETTNAVPGT
jgi:hypothetical protein